MAKKTKAPKCPPLRRGQSVRIKGVRYGAIILSTRKLDGYMRVYSPYYGRSQSLDRDDLTGSRRESGAVIVAGLIRDLGPHHPHYQYFVVKPRGERAVIVAGCRSWSSFYEARAYYAHTLDRWRPLVGAHARHMVSKAMQSIDILAHLERKAKRAGLIKKHGDL